VVSPDHYITLTEVHLWQNSTGWRGGDWPAEGNRSGSVRGWPGRFVLFAGPLLSAHLPTTSKLEVVWPAAIVRPPGWLRRRGAFPADIPADANGGLCIGRSCADHRGLGAFGHQQAAQGIYPCITCPLLSAPI